MASGLRPERPASPPPGGPHLQPREVCTSGPGGLHLHRLGLDPHDATALLLNLDVLRDHALLRRRYLLCQDTQDLVSPLQHLLQHRVLQIYRSEKGKKRLRVASCLGGDGRGMNLIRTPLAAEEEQPGDGDDRHRSCPDDEKGGSSSGKA